MMTLASSLRPLDAARVVVWLRVVGQRKGQVARAPAGGLLVPAAAAGQSLLWDRGGEDVVAGGYSAWLQRLGCRS
jgi:hypothetical protein